MGGADRPIGTLNRSLYTGANQTTVQPLRSPHQVQAVGAPDEAAVPQKGGGEHRSGIADYVDEISGPRSSAHPQKTRGKRGRGTHRSRRLRQVMAVMLEVL